MAASAGRVLSVNVGALREFEYDGRPARSAIWKAPAVGRVAVRDVNLSGDDQADRKAHSGPDKVVYAYAIEDAGGGKSKSADRLGMASSARISPLKGWR